ncbi:MAG: retropepsin-like domain-containing protein, partial [Bacteroidetes bacterium]|nr:retropepsin-like domain-containing protein [Bacteroidota bacterium]
TLTAFDVISFKAVINGTDTLLLHFDTGSWDVHLTKDAIIKKTKLLSGQPDFLAGKAPANFNKLNKVHKLQIGKLVFDNPDCLPTDITAREMDGRFGWTLFEGRQVELDFDKQLMIVHSGRLKKAPKGFIKSELLFKHSFLLVKGGMHKGAQVFDGDFLLDTGSDRAVILDSAWAAIHNYAQDLPVIRTITLRDPRGNTFETRVVRAPAFEVAGIRFNDVPALVLVTRNPVGFPVNDLCNDVFKRFNVIMDFKNDCIYWKPNGLAKLPYRSDS